MTEIPADQQYQNLDFVSSEIEHKYGDNIHILKDPYLMTLLNRLSTPDTDQPLITQLVEKMYRALFYRAASLCFCRKKVATPTRMRPFHPEGLYQGEVIDDSGRAISVSLARAGILPSQLIYHELNILLKPVNVRQDHFYIARRVNQENQVVGVDISGSKIGGDIQDAYLFLPDPMGATGGTICESLGHYKNSVEGVAKKIVALHLIITPEYIKKVKKLYPEVVVIAIRLDRGLSSPEILRSIPGTNIDQEKGLNQNQYIVPGAGGLGEILNNSFV